jgi:hypothetical protein
MDDTNTTIQMPAEQTSNASLWYIVGGVAILSALGLWYFSSQTPAEEMPAVSDDTSAAAINAEIEQLPDDSELDQDAAASAQAVQSF